MLKREITYIPYFNEDGTKATEPVTEIFYFNLNEVELTRFQEEMGGDVATRMTELMREGKRSEVLQAFEDLILNAYGKREGTEFNKSPDLRNRFSQSAAYNALFVEFTQDFDKVLEFMRGITPDVMHDRFDEEAAKIEPRIAQAQEALGEKVPEPPVPPTPPTE